MTVENQSNYSDQSQQEQTAPWTNYTTCNSLEAREKWRLQGAIGCGFASDWLKNWFRVF